MERTMYIYNNYNELGSGGGVNIVWSLHAKSKKEREEVTSIGQS
jgi:hypothetical protein